MVGSGSSTRDLVGHVRIGGLKRWSTNRQGWWRLRRCSSRVVHYEDAVLVLLEVHEVVEPLWVACAGERVKILDDGFAWLFVLREGARHVVTAHCDAAGEPVHWYVDVVEGWWMGDDGFPVYADLFLDVVATPGGSVELLDVVELEAALAADGVTSAQYELARSEADRLVRALRAGEFQPAVWTREYLAAARSASRMQAPSF